MYSLSLLTTTVLVLTIASLNSRMVLAGDDFVSSIVDTYDLLYNKGVEAYTRQRWFECLTHLNGALTDYRVYRSTLVTCKRECRKKSSDDDGALSTKPRITEMQIFFRILKRSNCIRKCKQNHFGNRPDVLASRGIEEEFEFRKPYDFLQYCHYKLDNIKEAVASSYTFLMANPKHKATLKNLLYYQRLPGILDDHFIDMERKIFQSLFIKAQEYQMMENWQGVIDTIEPAINDFIKEVDNCELLCEGSYDHEAFPEFINAVADHYVNILKCQTACEDKVSYLHGEKMEGFLPEMYNYLQFAYYQLNNLDSAIKAVASYLLFKPENANMQENKRIYIEKGASPDEVVPRPEAMNYYLRTKQQKSMLKFIKENYVPAFEEEGEESDDEQTIDLDNVNPTDFKHLNENHHLYVFQKFGLRIMAEPNDLFGDYRLVVDGFLREDQCQELVDFAALQEDKNGFRTISILEAIKKINESHDQEITLRLFLRSSSIAKHFMQRYLNHNLYHHTTRIICKDKWDGNCFMTETGKCSNESLPQGTFHAITYLTDIEKDAGSFFPKPDEIIIRPKCGRMVTYKSSDPVGVKPFSDPDIQRCVLLNVFDNTPSQDEINHIDASLLLKKIDQQRVKVNSNDRKKVLKTLKEQGVEVTMTSKDLRGKERFVADGLASDEECEALIELANVGSVRGDGYKHQQGTVSLISPHTKHEMFQGLTVARAAKLAKEKVIGPDSVDLYLKLAEKGRLMVEKYLNLTRPLYFDFTHLVCRTAVDDEAVDRKDLSHPIHADNCLLQPDGTCLKEVPAYIQRDYSGIIYLNQEFDGGEFIFAYPNKSEQTSVKPKCGRLVGFNAADLHGVKAVLKGQRCCLAMWYTQDPNFKELAHNQAQKVLKVVHAEVEAEENDEKDNESQTSKEEGRTETSSKDTKSEDILGHSDEL